MRWAATPTICPTLFRTVEGLGREIGEWTDDPFGANGVPSWGHIGQKPACQNNLEVGDPLTGTHVKLQSNGNIDTLRELAYISGFCRRAPSSGADGWHSLFNSVQALQPVCQ